jgi:PadR family transcriptional regulator PadR
MISNELVKGTLKTIVLNLLVENNRMYGYEITREVEKISEGKIMGRLIKPDTNLGFN